MHERTSLPVLSINANSVVKSVFTRSLREIQINRSANLELSNGGKFTINATCRSGRKLGVYKSLQIQMIGRLRIPLIFDFLPGFCGPPADLLACSFGLSLMKRTRNSMDANGAPSISSSMMQFGRRS